MNLIRVAMFGIIAATSSAWAASPISSCMRISDTNEKLSCAAAILYKSMEAKDEQHLRLFNELGMMDHVYLRSEDERWQMNLRACEQFGFSAGRGDYILAMMKRAECEIIQTDARTKYLKGYVPVSKRPQ